MVSKKNLYLFLGVFLLVFGFGVYAYTQQIPNPGHGGDKVLVTINGFTMTLQEAIDYEFLVDGGPNPSESYSTSGDHTGDEIYVSVNGNGKTLQDAISTSLCVSAPSFYFSEINLGHSAEDVLVSIDDEERTLQNVINEGKFCGDICISHSYSACAQHPGGGPFWYDYWFDSCGVQEERRTAPYEDVVCYNEDVYWLDACGDRQNKKEECGGGHSCSDGKCVFVSESGTGCGDCPDGYETYGDPRYPYHDACNLPHGNMGRYRNPISGEWSGWTNSESYAARCYSHFEYGDYQDYDLQWQIGYS